MSTDALQCPEQQPVGEVLRVVAAARTMQPEALNTVHAVGDAGHLVGTATLIQLLQADPAARLREVMDHDSVRVTAETDAVDIALLMADFNLITVPVVDEDNRVLGVVTVDDVLEATIPDDWRRREPAPKPPANPEWEESEPVVSSGPPGHPDTAAVDD
jgi:Mg/Co/Ni transporter MgtE